MNVNGNGFLRSHSHLRSSIVLRRCRLGDRKGIRPIKETVSNIVPRSSRPDKTEEKSRCRSNPGSSGNQPLTEVVVVVLATYLHIHSIERLNQGRSDGEYIGIYTLPKSVPEIFCALIAADVVRLLVYRTVVSCSKKLLYSPKMNFWLRPWSE